MSIYIYIYNLNIIINKYFKMSLEYRIQSEQNQNKEA